MAYKGGKETRVNSYTLGDQHMPAVAALKDGGWLVTWASEGEDGDQDGVYQQRYDADGSKHGGEKHVSTTTADVQFEPAITALPNGGWVETWSSRDKLATSFEIYQQAYGADGKRLGGETRVNTETAGEQSHSAVTALKDGGWVVTWQTQSDHGDNFDIHQRAYGKNGKPLGGEVTVNTVAASDQFDADVAALKNGGWIVTWSSYGHQNDFSGIYRQAYNADGTPAGDEMRVNTHTAGNQYHSTVTSLADGSYVVAWDSQDQDGSGDGIYQQHFDIDGDKIGGEKRVNTHTALDQQAPDIAALSNGGWVVTWQSDNQDGNTGGIYTQVYHADGSKDGKEFRVNQHTNSEQLDPSVTALKHGGFVIEWQSYDIDGDKGAVMQRVFKPVSNAAPDSAHFIPIIIPEPEIDGTKHDDTLTGKDDAEIFHGKGGKDTINAGGGNDRLDGGRGDDLLIGGDGKDTFVFKTGYGHDTIRGFFDGDRVDFSHLDSLKNFDDVVSHADQIGPDVMIDCGGDTLFIRHAWLGQLSADDFIFSH